MFSIATQGNKTKLILILVVKGHVYNVQNQVNLRPCMPDPYLDFY